MGARRGVRLLRALCVHRGRCLRSGAVRLPEARARPPGMTPIATAAIPRVALSRSEAAAALGISLDSFERHVQPDLRLIRRGRLVLVPVAELERWAESVAERTLP